MTVHDLTIVCTGQCEPGKPHHGASHRVWLDGVELLGVTAVSVSTDVADVHRASVELVVANVVMGQAATIRTTTEATVEELVAAMGGVDLGDDSEGGQP